MMHDERLWDLRQKRDREMHGIPEWEELRSLASAIKEHTLTRLDEYYQRSRWLTHGGFSNREHDDSRWHGGFGHAVSSEVARGLFG